jgi:hypothetical protein
MALALALTAGSSAARADQPATAASASTPPAQELGWTSALDVTSVPSFLLFAGGALSALTFHELGHVLANLAYGNVPGVSGILYAKAIPWFVIDPHLTLRDGVYYKRDGSVFQGGGRGYYVINTAGFMVQNLGSEIVLSTHPRLLHDRAPFAKGLLWMNMLLSIGYSTASFVGAEDPHGDISGGARHSGYPRQLIAGMVLANGTLDLFRFFFPDNQMLPWLSRTSKAMLLGLDIPFD